MNDLVLVNVPKNLVIPLFHRYFGEIAAVSTREQGKIKICLASNDRYCYYHYYLLLLCSMHLVGVGVVTLESGDQCIPVFFAEKSNDSALVGRYKICF